MKRDRLIEDNMGLVFYTIKKYFPYLMYDEDIFQIGCIGLISASKTFNSEKGKFSTYAVLIIRGQIFNYVRDESAQKREVHRHTVSLDQVVNRSSGEKEIRLKDLYLEQVDIENIVLQQIEIKNILCMLNRLPRQQKICFTAYYIKDMSQPEISKLIGVSQVTVSRNIKRATNSLKNMLQAS